MKKVLFPLISLALCYLTVGLVETILTLTAGEYSTGFTIWLSFLLTLYVTGVFAFTGFAYPTNRVMTNRYYKISNPKFLTSISKALGVEYFRFMLLITFWGTKKNRKKYFNGTKAGLKNFIYQTKQSEFGHFGAFVAITAISIILLIYCHVKMVLIITLINIIGNLYPILLQRLHRMRIERVLAVKER